MLQSRATVVELARRLDAPISQVGRAAPTLIPQREQLRNRLVGLAEAHATAAWYGERRSLPWWLALALSALLFGLPAGLATGFLYHMDRSPFAHYEQGRSSTSYFDALGYPLNDEVSFSLVRRKLDVTAALLGTGVGIAVTALFTFLASWFRFHRWPLLLALLVGAGALGVPAGFGAGMLYLTYFQPDHRYQSGCADKYVSYLGDEISFTQYQLQGRHITTQAILLGIATGLVLTIGITTLAVWRYGRRQAQARQRAALLAHDIVMEHPEVVEAWGGSAALRDRAFVEEALRGLQPVP